MKLDRKMLRLADTSILLFRKGDGTASVRWRSFLMIQAKKGFRLSAYLNRFECSVTLAGGPTINFDEVSYTEDCQHSMDHMVHEVWAAGSTPLGVLRNTVGLLRVEYRLFTYDGQGAASVIEQVVPVLARGTAEQRLGARYTNTA